MVAVIYAAIVVLALFPALATAMGGTPLQSAAIALILLVVLAHGLAWEFMMEPDEQPVDDSDRRTSP